MKNEKPWNPDPDPNFFRISGRVRTGTGWYGTVYIEYGSGPRTKIIKSMLPLLFYFAFVS
jgi:hypothetical protein